MSDLLQALHNLLVANGWRPPSKAFIVEQNIHKYMSDLNLQALLQIENEYPLSSNACWEWHLPESDGRYSFVKINGVSVRAHRAMYLIRVGPIPVGYHVDHLCSNGRCVNWSHLQAVSSRENQRRAMKRAKEEKLDGLEKGTTAREKPAQGQEGADRRREADPAHTGRPRGRSGGPLLRGDGDGAPGDDGEHEHSSGGDRDVTQQVLEHGHGADSLLHTD